MLIGWSSMVHADWLSLGTVDSNWLGLHGGLSLAELSGMEGVAMELAA